MVGLAFESVVITQAPVALLPTITRNPSLAAWYIEDVAFAVTVVIVLIVPKPAVYVLVGSVVCIPPRAIAPAARWVHYDNKNLE